MNRRRSVLLSSISIFVSLFAGPALAGVSPPQVCSALPSWSALQGALQTAVANANNGGLGFNMWGTIVANDGTVCAVAFSGISYTSQWLGSRVISAQKANTASDFSLGKNSTPGTSLYPAGLALSTANLYSAVQPGGSLYGLQHSNPVDTAVAYSNTTSNGSGVQQANYSSGPVSVQLFGTSNDPMVGQRIGGVNVFGGGLALYKGGAKVGGVGVSGDTSCTDHMFAWRVRSALGFDQFQGVKGVSGDTARPDNIVFDITANPNGGTGISKGGFGHPTCLNNPDPSTLPAVH
jgi:hypothetical protein